MNDITDKILFSRLNNYEEVLDIEYNKKLSQESSLDMARIYKITFKDEQSIDRIVPQELKYLNNRTDIPVDANLLSTGQGSENTIYIRLS